MKKIALATTIAALTCSAAFADTYRAEVGLTIDQYSPDAGDDFNKYTLFGDVYFQDVDASVGPRNEAPFLNKASSVGLDYTNVDQDNVDDAFALDGRFIIGEKWIVEAMYGDNGGDVVDYGIGFGWYLNDMMDLVFIYDTTDADNAPDNLTARMHGVAGQLGYTAYLGYIDTDDDSGSKIGGDLTYYINNDLGIGAMIDYASVGDNDATDWGIYADWFVAPAFDLRLDYSTANDGDDSEIGLTGSFRF
ncbi:putative porin [Agaribacterium haliotis]|uniref:putative porin n=1 Tax=Agaribacterium haliotis TaxID=2013869 RepID=UPI00195B8885|nr:putative porin [Agaribacterium haliotis]